MPQYLIVIAAVFVFLKEQIQDIFKTKESRFLLVGLVGYWLYAKQKDTEKLQAIKDNLPNSELGQLLVKLHNALHLYFNIPIPFGGGYVPFDGLDTDKALEVAYQVGKLRKYAEFAESYELMYKISLSDDLAANDIQEKWLSEYNRGYNGQQTTKQATASNKAPIIGLGTAILGAGVKNKAGVTIRVNGYYQLGIKANARTVSAPYQLIRVADAGEQYKVHQIKSGVVINNKTYTVAFCRRSYFDTLVGFENYMIIIDAFNKDVTK